MEEKPITINLKFIWKVKVLEGTDGQATLQFVGRRNYITPGKPQPTLMKINIPIHQWIIADIISKIITEYTRQVDVAKNILSYIKTKAQ